VPEGLTDTKRFLPGGGTRGFSVLMRYASLDRLSDGYEAQTGPPTRNAGAASVETRNILKSVHMSGDRDSRFNGTKGLVGAMERDALTY